MVSCEINHWTLRCANTPDGWTHRTTEHTGRLNTPVSKHKEKGIFKHKTRVKVINGLYFRTEPEHCECGQHKDWVICDMVMSGVNYRKCSQKTRGDNKNYRLQLTRKCQGLLPFYTSNHISPFRNSEISRYTCT